MMNDGVEAAAPPSSFSQWFAGDDDADGPDSAEWAHFGDGDGVISFEDLLAGGADEPPLETLPRVITALRVVVKDVPPDLAADGGVLSINVEAGAEGGDDRAESSFATAEECLSALSQFAPLDIVECTQFPDFVRGALLAARLPEAAMAAARLLLRVFSAAIEVGAAQQASMVAATVACSLTGELPAEIPAAARAECDAARFSSALGGSVSAHLATTWAAAFHCCLTLLLERCSLHSIVGSCAWQYVMATALCYGACSGLHCSDSVNAGAGDASGKHGAAVDSTVAAEMGSVSLVDSAVAAEVGSLHTRMAPCCALAAADPCAAAVLSPRPGAPAHSGAAAVAVAGAGADASAGAAAGSSAAATSLLSAGGQPAALSGEGGSSAVYPWLRMLILRGITRRQAVRWLLESRILHAAIAAAAGEAALSKAAAAGSEALSEAAAVGASFDADSAAPPAASVPARSRAGALVQLLATTAEGAAAIAHARADLTAAAAAVAAANATTSAGGAGAADAADAADAGRTAVLLPALYRCVRPADMVATLQCGPATGAGPFTSTAQAGSPAAETSVATGQVAADRASLTAQAPDSGGAGSGSCSAAGASAPVMPSESPAACECAACVACMSDLYLWSLSRIAEGVGARRHEDADGKQGDKDKARQHHYAGDANGDDPRNESWLAVFGRPPTAVRGFRLAHEH